MQISFPENFLVARADPGKLNFRFNVVFLDFPIKSQGWKIMAGSYLAGFFLQHVAQLISEIDIHPLPLLSPKCIIIYFVAVVVA